MASEGEVMTGKTSRHARAATAGYSARRCVSIGPEHLADPRAHSRRATDLGSGPAPRGCVTPMARVVMFVLNDCTTDARVLREAPTLARPATRSRSLPGRRPVRRTRDREERGGFRILRAPVGAGMVRWSCLRGAPRGWRGSSPRRPDAASGPVVGPGAGRPGTAGPGVPACAAGALVFGLSVAIVCLSRSGGRRGWRSNGVCNGDSASCRGPGPPWTRRPDGDVFHAHDLRALPAAPQPGPLRRPGGLRQPRDLRRGARNARRPGPPGPRSSGWSAGSRAAAALVTVNDDLAAVLGEPSAWATGSSLSAIADLAGNRASRIRAARRASGMTPVSPCCLHGPFVADRGFEQLAAALALPPLADVHAAYSDLGRSARAWTTSRRRPPLPVASTCSTPCRRASC